MMIQSKAQVLWNKAIGSLYYKIGMACDAEFSKAVPGQFVMLSLDSSLEPLLRRPFSIHKPIVQNGQYVGIEVLYKVVGTFTRKLMAAGPAAQIDVIGPLGNGFHIADTPQRSYLVAGGIGVAPMVFLAQRLKDGGSPPELNTVFLGGQSTQDLLCREDFEKLNMRIHLTTDDGTSGDQCLVTDPLALAVQTMCPDIIYACGPPAMLKCVAGIAEHHQIRCQMSIETIMACGIGACLGCNVEMRKGSQKYQHVCVDGPIFEADAIVI